LRMTVGGRCVDGWRVAVGAKDFWTDDVTAPIRQSGCPNLPAPAAMLTAA
jgi:hypothetical protein